MSVTAATARQLRERGIYCLPDGTRVVASYSADVEDANGGALYTESEWSACVAADLEFSEDGLVQSLGDWTGWTTDDLADTGETAEGIA